MIKQKRPLDMAAPILPLRTRALPAPSYSRIGSRPSP
jgi:hypothetical protein